MTDFIHIIQQDPAVENVVGFTGGSQRNSGFMFIQLKPLAERKLSADQVDQSAAGKLAREPGASLFLQSVQDIRVGAGPAMRSTNTRCRPMT
ncbi:efflux RND transporter permease subunit [Cupriavidus basilensis]